MAARARLFLASYAPLFLILTVRFEEPALQIACGALCAVGAVDAGFILSRVRRRKLTHSINVKAFDDMGGEVSGYLASYLLPFITAATPTVRDLIGYGIFLLVAAVIYVRSDLVRVNPIFYTFGYRVLRIEFGQQGRDYLLARKEPRIGETVAVVEVAGILVAAGAPRARG